MGETVFTLHTLLCLHSRTGAIKNECKSANYLILKILGKGSVLIIAASSIFLKEEKEILTLLIYYSVVFRNIGFFPVNTMQFTHS